MGLMLRKSAQEEYKGVRRGGGKRVLLLQANAPYKETIEKTLRGFFPGKKSVFGTLASYTIDGLGTYQGLIPEEGFDLCLLVEANGGASRTSLYVYMTQKKVNMIEININLN